MAVRIERQLLPVDGDDDAEHALGLGGDVLGAGLCFCRVLLPRHHDQAVGLGRRPQSLRLLRWPLLIERKRLGGRDAREQCGARRHHQ